MVMVKSGDIVEAFVRFDDGTWAAAEIRFRQPTVEAHARILEIMTPALLKCAISGSGWHRLEATFRNDSRSIYVLDFKVRQCDSSDFEETGKTGERV
jgi:hypothetical protein